MMTYEQALAYLESLNTFGINLGLARILKMLELMGHPEKKYKTIHITGTNGKGSVTATLTSILGAAGIKTGMYTSPHLSSYTERIVINGEQVSEEQFAGAILYAKNIIAQMLAEGCEHPTQFEVLTAAAFYLFACAKVEYAVIEVGLGGLLDSTNVIIPEVSVITNVTLEHTDRCGKTVKEIAKHKAGIIKPGVPVVTAAKDDALAVIWETAARLNAPLYLPGRDFSVKFIRITFAGQEVELSTKEKGALGKFMIRLLGKHQQENSSMAVMAALILAKKEKRITVDAIRSGLKTVFWPARFEILSQNPLTILDGAHNPAGVTVLRATLDEMFPKEPVTFVLGILRDKNIREMVKLLIRPADKVVTVRPHSERAASAEEIAREINADYVETAPSISVGIDKAKSLHPKILCVTGSFYLAGIAREILTGQKL